MSDEQEHAALLKALQKAVLRERKDVMALSESPRARALREFESTNCPVEGCGAAKARGQSFCSRCYFSLPKEMRDALYQRFGSGYEEAHEDAREFLEQERRAKS